MTILSSSIYSKTKRAVRKKTLDCFSYHFFYSNIGSVILKTVFIQDKAIKKGIILVSLRTDTFCVKERR